MGAKDKLNMANVQGAVVVAGICGYFFESWDIFIGCVVMLVGMAYTKGNIR